MNAVKIIILANNEKKYVMLQIESLLKLSKLSYEDIIVVDNNSDDGLGEWLAQQERIDYVLCDEKVETYADIFDMTVQEFVGEEDLILLRPEFLLLPGTLEDLKDALYSSDDIGAVYPERMLYGENGKSTLDEAINYAVQRKQKIEYWEKMALPAECVMIRNEMIRKIGKADNTLYFPQSVLTDMAIRGMQCGYRYIEVKGIYCYQFASAFWVYEKIYEEDVDKERMKNKWNMNYFGERENYELVSDISEAKEESIHVLEIGCDCGANLLYIKNCYRNAELYGVEINPAAAAIASRFAKVTVGNIEEQNLDFEREQFDYILFGDVLEHLRNPAKVISYCKKFLKPDGKILASIPNLMNYAVIYELLNGNFSYSDDGLLDRTHIHFFTYNEIIRMFEEEGYEVERMKYVQNGHYGKAEQNFVQQLLALSEQAEEFMFVAFQYVVEVSLGAEDKLIKLYETVESQRLKMERFSYEDTLGMVRKAMKKRGAVEDARLEKYLDCYRFLLIEAKENGNEDGIIAILREFLQDIEKSEDALSAKNLKKLEKLKDEMLVRWVAAYAKRAYSSYQYNCIQNVNAFQGRGVIYTVLTGDYDLLNEPQVIDDQFDYICFTDNDYLQSKIWQIRIIDNDEQLDLARLSRKPKILCHKYLQEYDYSIYVDAKMLIVGDFRAYIEEYSKGNTMLCFPHYMRDCAYEEAEACVQNGKDDPVIISNQMLKYQQEGFPSHYGMIDAACMVRLHNDAKLIKTMEDWWNEVRTKSKRDQLSFEYVCWKNDYHYDLCDLVSKNNAFIRDNREGEKPY